MEKVKCTVLGSRAAYGPRRAYCGDMLWVNWLCWCFSWFSLFIICEFQYS